ncbi:MAG: hypothetical protein H5T42_06650 [Methanothrix sp.]|uniref:hypothetical protein n=1 Tax=Methanothrix sp. TaxID=90426 RepID=UPI0019B451EE|nr:hypothetical protein [Methanothrix sp.]MBC7080130.1 hypothetical protein [Methanothrix sp.]NPU88244.1 hypothetical protein [Methanothrix sp.]
MNVKICAALIAAILILSVPVHAAEITGLWDFRYDVAWSTTSEMLGSTIISIIQNGSVITGDAYIEEPEQMEGRITGTYAPEGFQISATMYRRHILIISLRGSSQDSGLLRGSFVAASSDGRAWRGSFIATLTNPDPRFLGNVTSVGEKNEVATESKAAPTTTTPAKSRFFDIHYSRDETIYPRPVM